LNSNLLSQLQSGTAIYRNPKAPHYYTTNHSSEPEWLSAHEYLTQRVAKDGPWGVILTQTSNDAGMSSMVGKSPDELTAQGTQHLEVRGQRVDGLGVLEWLAMTLQHIPAELSASDASWLLANRLEVDGVARVPSGFWDVGRVVSFLDDADRRNDVIRPRLAVI